MKRKISRLCLIPLVAVMAYIGFTSQVPEDNDLYTCTTYCDWNFGTTCVITWPYGQGITYCDNMAAKPGYPWQ